MSKKLEKDISPWILKWSHTKMRQYYYNPITNESQWSPPRSADKILSKTKQIGNQNGDSKKRKFEDSEIVQNQMVTIPNRAVTILKKTAILPTEAVTVSKQSGIVPNKSTIVPNKGGFVQNKEGKVFKNIPNILWCEEETPVELPAAESFEEEDMEVDMIGVEIRGMREEIQRSGFHQVTHETQMIVDRISSIDLATADTALDQQKLLIVVDTNVFLEDTKYLCNLKNIRSERFGYPILAIPWVVMQEIDYFKDMKTGNMTSKKVALQGKAREAVNLIHRWLKETNRRVICQTPQESEDTKRDFTLISNDDFILQCCLQMISKCSDNHVVLLTQDKHLRTKSMITEIPAYSKDELMDWMTKYETPSRKETTSTIYQTPARKTATSTICGTPARQQTISSIYSTPASKQTISETPARKQTPEPSQNLATPKLSSTTPLHTSTLSPYTNTLSPHTDFSLLHSNSSSLTAGRSRNLGIIPTKKEINFDNADRTPLKCKMVGKYLAWSAPYNKDRLGCTPVRSCPPVFGTSGTPVQSPSPSPKNTFSSLFVPAPSSASNKKIPERVLFGKHASMKKSKKISPRQAPSNINRPSSPLRKLSSPDEGVSSFRPAKLVTPSASASTPTIKAPIFNDTIYSSTSDLRSGGSRPRRGMPSQEFSNSSVLDEWSAQGPDGFQSPAQVNGPVARIQSARDHHVEEIFEELKDVLHRSFSEFLEMEMRAIFEDMWETIIFISKPWSLADIFTCMNKHWFAAFGSLWPRSSRSSQATVEQLVKTIDENCSAELVRKILSDCLSLLRNFDATKAFIPENIPLYKSLSATLLSDLNRLQQRLTESLESNGATVELNSSSAAVESDLIASSETPQTPLALSNNLSSSSFVRASQNLDLTSQNVAGLWNCFNEVWTKLNQQKTALVEEMSKYSQGIESSYSRELVLNEFMRVCSFINVLCRHYTGALLIQPEAIEGSIEFDHLLFVLASICRQFQINETYLQNSDLLKLIFKDESTRQLLVTAGGQLEQMLQELSSCDKFLTPAECCTVQQFIASNQ